VEDEGASFSAVSFFFFASLAVSLAASLAASFSSVLKNYCELLW